MIVFYARKRHVARLIDAVIEADCHIVNNGAKLELYADDVRKLHRFAIALRGLDDLRWRRRCENALPSRIAAPGFRSLATTRIRGIA